MRTNEDTREPHDVSLDLSELQRLARINSRLPAVIGSRFDAEADVFYVVFEDECPDSSTRTDDILVHYFSNRLIGITISNASKHTGLLVGA